MAVTVSNVLVGQATLYTAPFGTTPPLDTLADGAAWLAPWTHVGATEEGVSLAVGSDTNDIRIEEQATPVLVLVTNKNIRVLTALSEDTVETMKLAFGGGTIVTTAAATGVPGKKTLTLSDNLDSLACGFEGQSPQGFFRRVIIPKVVSVGDVTAAYRRAANNRSYTTELRCLSASNLVTITDKTAVAL